MNSPYVDPSADYNAALHNAACRGSATVVRILLEDDRVDPTSCGNDAVVWAASLGNVEVTYVLISDSRVNACGAISGASKSCARILAAHPRWGIHAYPELYAKYHPELTAEYERVRGQCRVVAWLAHSQLRAWEGVAQWVVERLQGFLLY